MSAFNVHDDWLSLIEISGPFLAVPVLKEAFPQGLEGLDGIKKKRLRQAYEEWREALELEDEQFAELHAAWIEEVLSRGLELDEDGKGDEHDPPVEPDQPVDVGAQPGADVVGDGRPGHPLQARQCGQRKAGGCLDPAGPPRRRRDGVADPARRAARDDGARDRA